MQLPGEFSPFIEKSGYPLSGPTTKKKHFFYVCLPLEILKKNLVVYFSLRSSNQTTSIERDPVSLIFNHLLFVLTKYMF